MKRSDLEGFGPDQFFHTMMIGSMSVAGDGDTNSSGASGEEHLNR